MFWSSDADKDIVLKSSSNAGEDSNHVKLNAYLLLHSAMQVRHLASSLANQDSNHRPAQL